MGALQVYKAIWNEIPVAVKLLVRTEGATISNVDAVTEQLLSPTKLIVESLKQVRAPCLVSYSVPPPDTGCRESPRGASQSVWMYICPQTTKSMYQFNGMHPSIGRGTQAKHQRRVHIPPTVARHGSCTLLTGCNGSIRSMHSFESTPMLGM